MNKSKKIGHRQATSFLAPFELINAGKFSKHKQTKQKNTSKQNKIYMEIQTYMCVYIYIFFLYTYK